MNSLRVTFVLPRLFRHPIGGYRIVFEYADRLAQRGHRVSVVFPRPQDSFGDGGSLVQQLKRKLWPLKTRLTNRPLIPWHSFKPGVRTVLARAVDDIEIPDADVIVATAWNTADPVAKLSPQKGRKYYLIQSHETWAGPPAAVDATWLLPMKKIVIARWLYDLGKSLGADDMRHIPNAIDRDRFKLTRPLDKRPLSILTIYHRSEVKGVTYAIKALEMVHQRHPEVAVTMFGTEPAGPEVPTWIRYVNSPSQEALVEELYNGHAIYLGASLLEGWALPPAEAMACGCAFVGTNIGGFRDYAIDGETALLAPAKDPQGLCDNLCKLIGDPDLLRRIQEAGMSHLKRFDWDRSVSEFEEYLLEGASNLHGRP
jgi:glycosyltransferase involved in cell wall biosynthesis